MGNLQSKTGWNGLCRRIGCGRVIPILKNLSPLAIVEQYEVTQPPRRIERCLLKKTLEVQHHPLSGGRQEKIDKVVQQDDGVVGIVVHSEVNIQKGRVIKRIKFL